MLRPLPRRRVRLRRRRADTARQAPSQAVTHVVSDCGTRASPSSALRRPERWGS